jgi:hypothetical protein
MSITSNVTSCLLNHRKTRDDIDVEEPSFVASNETVLNVKSVYRSVDAGDAVADTVFISGVYPLPIAT